MDWNQSNLNTEIENCLVDLKVLHSKWHEMPNKKRFGITQLGDRGSHLPRDQHFCHGTRLYDHGWKTGRLAKGTSGA